MSSSMAAPLPLNQLHLWPEELVPVIVVAVPFPMQGHLTPLLHLCGLLSSSDIPVHYVGSATHIRQAMLRELNSTSIPRIEFHGFPIPTFSSAPPPNPHSSIKFPSHLQDSFEATLLHLQDPVASLLRALSQKARRIIVIHDPLMASVVQDSASISNAETFAFQTNSAFSMLSFYCQYKPMAPAKLATGPYLQGCFTPEFVDLILHQQKFSDSKVGDLHNTSRAIEGDHIDLLARELLVGKKQFAIGPLLLPLNITKEDRCLKWLDQKETKSVLYVSFGTTTSLEEEQIHELAIGLEESETNFIWVLRDADKADVFAEDEDEQQRRRRRQLVLPEGYEERIKGRGMVVRDWVPQVEILSHDSVGGFMSHCGWNSCMESMAMGVPIAAWPMHADQPQNTGLVTELLGVGIVVKDWSRREDIVRSSAVKAAVRKLMDSHEIRKEAEKVGEEVRRAAAAGGISRRELDSFIEYIKR